jgi:hypothetical protein
MAFEEFELAGDMFCKIGLNKLAAQCFFTSKKFEKSSWIVL